MTTSPPLCFRIGDQVWVCLKPDRFAYVCHTPPTDDQLEDEDDEDICLHGVVWQADYALLEEAVRDRMMTHENDFFHRFPSIQPDSIPRGATFLDKLFSLHPRGLLLVHLDDEEEHGHEKLHLTLPWYFPKSASPVACTHAKAWPDFCYCELLVIDGQ